MMRSFLSLAACLLVLVSPAHAAGEAETKARASNPNTKIASLKAGQSATLICQSDAFTVHEHTFRSSRGVMSLMIELATLDDGKGLGKWRVLEVTGSHDVSIASALNDKCASGCEMRYVDGKGIELWAPTAKALDKLTKTEMLWLVTVDTATGALKASTFRGPAPAAFEKGKCEAKP